MPNPCLPPEILDCIVDLLHDNPNALKRCCLVSKSWTPRTRKHIFVNIRFEEDANLESWKETFPDPSTSPAHYANSLYVGCLHIVTAVDAAAGGWIRGFSRVVQLEVETHGAFFDELAVNLVPFHGLSPFIKSLRVGFVLLPSSRIFNLVLSFPVLEDLTLIGGDIPRHNNDGPGRLPTVVEPSNLPAFTGPLELPLEGGTRPTTSQLSSLLGGLHLRKFTSTWYREGDLLLTMKLVEEFSYTLESLDFTCSIHSEMGSHSADLSKATILKDVAFRVISWNVKWITTALRTVTPQHRDLRQISIFAAHYSTLVNIGGNVRRITGEQTLGQWLELDRLLAQLWESHSIRPKILYNAFPGKEKIIRDWVGCLLPEITERGVIDLVSAW